MTAMVRLIRLACAVSATTSFLDAIEFFWAVSTVVSINSTASVATFTVRLTTMSFFNCSVLTTSSLAARKRLTIESSELMTSSNRRSSASPRSRLKMALRPDWVFAIDAISEASPVAPNRQAMARSSFTLTSARYNSFSISALLSSLAMSGDASSASTALVHSAEIAERLSVCASRRVLRFASSSTPAV